ELPGRTEHIPGWTGGEKGDQRGETERVDRVDLAAELCREAEHDLEPAPQGDVQVVPRPGRFPRMARGGRYDPLLSRHPRCWQDLPLVHRLQRAGEPATGRGRRRQGRGRLHALLQMGRPFITAARQPAAQSDQAVRAALRGGRRPPRRALRKAQQGRNEARARAGPVNADSALPPVHQ
ncbi:hypothetical protein COL922a_014715, partial [Colletotrichum nupharicola]